MASLKKALSIRVSSGPAGRAARIDSKHWKIADAVGDLPNGCSRRGRLAEIPFRVHPHMLRHACGNKLANDGRDTRAISGAES
jgi:integrase